MIYNRDKSIKEVLKYEGGYVNHPADPGGETNYGITKAVARENGYHGSMRTIPMSVVLNIYTQKYWNTPYYNCDTLDSGVDFAVYDFGVNSGPSRANRFLMDAIGGSAEMTINRIYDGRLAWLKKLSTWPTFGKGWTSRVKQGRAFALKLAREKPPVIVEKKKKVEKDVKMSKEIKTASIKQGGIAVLIAASLAAVITWWDTAVEFIKGLF